MNEVLLKKIDCNTWVNTQKQRYSKDLREFDPCMPEQTIEDEKSIYTTYVDKNLFLILGIYDYKDNLLGFIQAFELKKLDSDEYSKEFEEFIYHQGGCICETGISILDKSNFRKGYGYQAYKLFLKYLQEKYNVKQTTISTYIKNKRAIGLYKKLGYKDFGYYKDEGYKYKKMLYEFSK